VKSVSSAEQPEINDLIREALSERKQALSRG